MLLADEPPLGEFQPRISAPPFHGEDSNNDRRLTHCFR